VGNLFEDPTLRRNLLEFVSGGGGLMGVHGTTVAFTHWPGAYEDWPEFGQMLGARGASHRDSDERVFIKVEDPAHPLVRAFGGQGFAYRDEFFRVHEPYSRDKLRVLLSIDTQQTDLKQGQARGNCERADNDYALAWVRSWGKGRVFYCTIAHNPYVFWDPKMLEFYLAAAQFVLGDLPADTTPSAKLGTGRLPAEQVGVPRIDPDYTMEVDQWWATHPFNPDSPHYRPEIRSPQPVVTLTSGQSIQEAVDKLPEGGGTIKLSAGTYEGFQIIGRSNVHVISDGEAVIHGPSVIAVCQEAIDYGRVAQARRLQHQGGGEHR
jgi:type 1 glutamine amidotransferase